jgi:surface protein
MSGMFENATMVNQNLSRWDTSSVECMRRMFDGATSFQQDVSSWGNGWDEGEITRPTPIYSLW